LVTADPPRARALFEEWLAGPRFEDREQYALVGLGQSASAADVALIVRAARARPDLHDRALDALVAAATPAATQAIAELLAAEPDRDTTVWAAVRGNAIGERTRLAERMERAAQPAARRRAAFALGAL